MSRGWTVDELAALSGVPSRTIREYKTLGLLPAPERIGRVGVYGPEHRRRLELIARLQSRGYSLAGIRDLLDAWTRGRSLAELVGDATIDEVPTAFSRVALVDAFPALADDTILTAAGAAGLVGPTENGRWLVRSSALLALVRDLCDAGVPVERVLETVQTLREHAAAQGRAIADLFVTTAWRDLEEESAGNLARRARPLVAQAIASLALASVGDALLSRAADSGDTELADFVDRLRVGVVVPVGPDLPTKESS